MKNYSNALYCVYFRGGPVLVALWNFVLLNYHISLNHHILYIYKEAKSHEVGEHLQLTSMVSCVRLTYQCEQMVKLFSRTVNIKAHHQ